MKYSIIAIFLFFSHAITGQEDSLLMNIRGLKFEGQLFLNVEGNEIACKTYEYSFTEKNVIRILRRHSIKRKSTWTVNENLDFEHMIFKKQEDTAKGKMNSKILFTSYYFVKGLNDKIVAIEMNTNVQNDDELEIKIVDLIRNNKIPNTSIDIIDGSIIDFGGRIIPTHSSCGWRSVNNLQCPYAGQMNWSVYQTKDRAEKNVLAQMENTKLKKGFSVEIEEDVNVIFEGIETKAKRIVLKLNPGLSGLTQSEELTVYYVVQKVRGNYIGCVMSFWNNDRLNDNGLPALLAEVMELKN